VSACPDRIRRWNYSEDFIPFYERPHRTSIAVEVPDNGSAANAHRNHRVATLLLAWRKSRSSTRLRAIHDASATLLIMYRLIGVCDFAQKPVSLSFINAEEHIEQQKEHFRVWWVRVLPIVTRKTPEKLVSQ